MSVRRLLTLTQHLPRDCALARSVLGHAAEWTNTEELLAAVIEVMDRGQLWFLQANSKKGARLPKPIRVPRPETPGAEPIDATSPPKSTGEALKELMAQAGGGEQ